MNKRIPEWLQNLPPGKYSLKFLVTHTRKHKSSIVRTLKNLKVKNRYPRNDMNFREALYTWKGTDK